MNSSYSVIRIIFDTSQLFEKICLFEFDVENICYYRIKTWFTAHAHAEMIKKCIFILKCVFIYH